METTSPYRPVLEHALRHALAHLENLEHTSVSSTATLAELRMRLARPLTNDGVNATQVIDELVADVSGGVLGSTGGRFFGWVIGGSVPAALAADYFGEMIFNGGKQVWRQSKTSIRGDPKDFSPPGRAEFFTACPFVTQISQTVPWVRNISDKPRARLHLTHSRTPGTHNKWSLALQSGG